MSVKTVRRRVRAGELRGQLVHDADIGVERWMIDPETLPTTGGTAAVIPIEILDRLEEAWREAREAHGRAEVAAREADFERERRQNIETERDALLAGKQATETERDELRAREQAAETDRLRLVAQIEDLEARRWWQRKG